MRTTPIPAPLLPPGRPRLVVAGFMGTGKTEAGRRAAALLGLPFLDLDEAIEARAGRPVARIFDEEGEEGFRRLERRVVLEASRLSGAVVAPGGGAVLDGASFGALADGSVTAVLHCDPDELVGRLQGSRRPLLEPDPPARTAELLPARAEAYAAAGPSLDTTGRSPDDVAAELAARYRRAAGPPSPARVEVAGPNGPYPVLIGEHALEGLPAEVGDVGRAALVLDPGARPVAELVAAALEEADVRVLGPVELPAGEAAKSLEELGRLWTALRDLGVERGDAVVAVGGGAALDAAGFAAATYARGLPLVNVPTTVLAMADAAVGGKVAVDHAGVKNLAGAFHHPLAVAADPRALRSLDPRTVRAGMGEVVKAALIGAPLVLEVLCRAPLEEPLLTWAVEQAVRVKAALVAADPRDTGPRHALNLGHTFAHAIEAAGGYRVPHGEAVAVGLVAAARLGSRLGVTPAGTEERIRRVLEALALPTAPPAELGPAALRAAMEADKKRRGGRIRFVLPASDGTILAEGPEPEAALSALLALAEEPR